MNSPVAKKQLVTSQNLSMAGMENFRSGKQLEAELERLERDRKSKLRELNQESKHFVELKLRSASGRSRGNSFSNGCSFPPISPRATCLTPSPGGSRSPSSSPPKSRSPSPRPVCLRKSLSTEGSHQCTSPSSSPEASKRLLSKRCPSPTPLSRNVTVTETTVMPLLPLLEKQIKHSPGAAIKTAERMLRSNTVLAEASASWIPQIVINDGSALTQPAARKSISTDRRPECSIDTKGHGPESSGGSLTVPRASHRRNSLPAVPTPPSYLRGLATKESTFVTDGPGETQGPVEGRPRSSSVCVPYFAHLKHAPRRDSLLRKYVAKPGCYRRTAATLEKLISDLARGVHHGELLEGPGPAVLSDEEWEQLKECRYLRMPSKDEDVVGNTLDVAAIFAKSEEEEKEEEDGKDGAQGGCKVKG